MQRFRWIRIRLHLLVAVRLRRYAGVGDPPDVVGPTMFFCSPAAAFVTGQVLYLDGGITASQ